MNKKQKLELTWIGKETRPKLEPRILLEDPAKSYHAAHRVSESDQFDNRLIFGDNLLALRALEQEFTGEVKCVYIDPPFNTGEAFEYYDDSQEHSIWLRLMQARLQILHRLLRKDGTIFVHIDDNELGYLIVLMDEIFGRSNRISIITFKQGSAVGHKAINPGVVNTSNFILVYARDKSEWKPNRVFTAIESRDTRYNRFIVNRNDEYKEWKFTTLTKAFADAMKISEKEIKKKLGDEYDLKITEFVMNNHSSVIRPARPDYDAVSNDARRCIDNSLKNPKEVFLLERSGFSDMYFIGGERILFYTDKLKSIDGQMVSGEPLTSIWDDLLSNNLHKEGGVDFPKGKKPESLIKRCLDLVTNPGDLVLDSFAGSGTTGAVAHKMGRRWILVEVKPHCDTHIVPRLRQVIDGMDSSGITKATGWKGGGGFRYYRLAPSLLKKDRFDNWIINKEYNPEMLAEAMCKLEGFTYAPSETVYWQHGHSTERDFLYVTTQTLSQEQLQALSDEVGNDRSLLVLCFAFRGSADAFPNLTIKKMPNHVLGRCEWDHDDYSLKVENLPSAPEPKPAPLGGLFGEEGGNA